MKYEIFVCNLLCVLSHFWKNANTEWVEMPEFSDETKVYRISAKHEHFYKFARKNAESNSYKDRDNSTTYSPDTKINNLGINESYQIMDPIEVFTLKSFTELSVPDKHFPENVDTDTDDDVDDIIITSDEKSIINEDENLNKSDGSNLTENALLEEDTYKSTKQNQSKDTNENDKGILDYLPIEILKKVHWILKSQSVSSEGKIEFLKSFERTLMTEIESRLAETMAPSRKTRGAMDHFDHGDEHEEHSLGFPSIEGALMAISFLTFAVYLVRLVMLLFRNMNNATPTTTGATVFVGKRKRSVDDDDVNEDTMRILSRIENFTPDI